MQQRLDARARRWVVALAALAVVALTARLGWWQLERAQTKQALQAAQDSAAAAPPIDGRALLAAPQGAWTNRTAQLRGEWVPAHSLWLDNRPMGGQSGFILLTPLRIAGHSDLIWVQRGWQARPAGPHQAPPWPPTPTGEVTVQGRLAPQASRAYALGAAASGPLKQNLDLAASAAEMRQPLLPWVLWQTADCAPQACDWPPPNHGVAKHHGYAAQWFALSALTLGLYVWFQLLRPRIQRRAA
jgi:surfeit locus 1 family protein